ncbi:class I SAM-dependent methyltransferase [bacterium]|nr:class I SAM-dependent methyltransferase [bacterium]
MSKEFIRQTVDKTNLRNNEKLYMWRLMRKVYQYFPRGCRVLDVGCGEGLPAEILAQLGCQVTAVDIESQTKEWVKRGSLGIKFKQASAEKLPFANGCFDAVWIKDAFHHMEHPERAMAELQRVTCPEGPIVVVEANRYNPVFYIHLTLLGDHQHYTQKALRKFLQQADPKFSYTLAESRCLPWKAAWILKLLELFEETLERIQICNPWLTYQIAVVKGKGK